MREILFRGKGDQRYNSGSWFYGYLCKDSDGDYQIRSDCSSRTVLKETIGQYTGLKDKNGKKIFEGDIIKYAFQHDYDCYIESLVHPEYYDGSDFSNIFEIDKVVYCSEWGYPAFDLDKHPFDCNSLSELSESLEYHFEVIGNIHDDKELLEEI